MAVEIRKAVALYFSPLRVLLTLRVYFGWKRCAGLVCVGWEPRTLRGIHVHFAMHPRYWKKWGFTDDWYDGPIRSVDAGPFFSVNWY